MKIYIIAICNKNEEYEKLLTEKYKKLIEKIYKIEFININFKTIKAEKNIYKKEYEKALSLIKQTQF
jgi:23S rRNA pseudoU1915 N3-methylase RlmH